MLEKGVIQKRGFRNIVEKGEVIGFQIRVRSLYYKGIYLSQLRPGSVEVDGETFNKNDVIWEIKGVDYTPAQMESIGNVNWELGIPAVLKIKKPGGLAQGYHDVSVTFSYSASYMPPAMDDPEKGMAFGGRSTKYTEKMLIV